MSTPDTDTLAQRTADACLGPGVLVLVVGASGAGKDTLLAHARAALAGDARVFFARRLITRTPDGTEDHDTLSEDEFTHALAAQRFPLAWRANGLGYALGEDVAGAIRAGRTVVANGSRAAVAEALKRFASVRVVHVTAPVELRARRLAARGRESVDAVAARLARTPVLTERPAIEIDNAGAPDVAGEQLTAFILGVR